MAMNEKRKTKYETRRLEQKKRKSECAWCHEQLGKLSDAFDVDDEMFPTEKSKVNYYHKSCYYKFLDSWVAVGDKMRGGK